MDKGKPNLKELIPNLSGKERAKLFFENAVSPIKFLTSEEEQLLSKMETQKQLDEWWEYFVLAIRRLSTTILFFNAITEFRSKVASLWSLDLQICYEMPLRAVQRFLDAGGDDVKIAKALLQDFLKRTLVIDSRMDNERMVEKISFTDNTLKDAVGAVFQDIEQLINIREALRRCDEKLENPRYPDGISGGLLNKYMHGIKSAQKLHNKGMFALLKIKQFLPDGFKKEIEDLNAHIIKTPKIRPDLVKKYMD